MAGFGDCDAYVSYPQRWVSGDRGPLYEMQLTIPDWREGGQVDVHFANNKTTGVDGHCWSATSTTYEPGKLSIRLGPPGAPTSSNAYRTGCRMQGIPDFDATTVEYVGNRCFVPPPPPPHTFSTCTGDLELHRSVQIVITSRTQTGWTVAVHMNTWRSGDAFRLGFGGIPFEVEAGSVAHASVRTATHTWTEFVLGSDPIEDHGHDEYGDYTIHGSGTFTFRLDPAPTGHDPQPQLMCDTGQDVSSPPAAPIWHPPPQPAVPYPPTHPLPWPAPPPFPSPGAPPNPPPSPPSLDALLPHGQQPRARAGEAGQLIAAVTDASVSLLRAKLGTRDAALTGYVEARDALEHPGRRPAGELEGRVSVMTATLRNASNNVDYAVDLVQQVHIIEQGLALDATVEQIVQRYGDVLTTKLDLDLSCCPSARAADEQPRIVPSTTTAGQAAGALRPVTIGLMVMILFASAAWSIRWCYRLLFPKVQLKATASMPPRRARGRAMKLEQVAECDDEWDEHERTSASSSSRSHPARGSGDDEEDWDVDQRLSSRCRAEV